MKTTMMPRSKEVYDGRSDVVSQQAQDRAKGMRAFMRQQSIETNTYGNTNDQLLKALTAQKASNVFETFKLDPLARELRASELSALSLEKLDAMQSVLDKYFDNLPSMSSFEQENHRKNAERLQAELDTRAQQKVA